MSIGNRAGCWVRAVLHCTGTDAMEHGPAPEGEVGRSPQSHEQDRGYGAWSNVQQGPLHKLVEGSPTEMPCEHLESTSPTSMDAMNPTEFKEWALQTYGLTTEDLRDYKQAFQLLDSNNDGIVEQGDIEIALQALGVAIDPGYIQLMLAAIDTNHTGGVKYQHFVSALNHQPPEQDSDYDLRQLYIRFKGEELDNIENLAKEIAHKNPSQADSTQAMLQYHDVDGDGFLSEVEFINAVEGAGIQETTLVLSALSAS